ncbi:MAG: CRTAC1 family protein [Myxococcota bacterium]|nr:CRTAC1 family protein [Myxococcota bacterium]
MARYLLPFLVFGCSSETPLEPQEGQKNAQQNPVDSTEQEWAKEYILSMNEIISSEKVYAALNPLEETVLSLEETFFLPLEQFVESATRPTPDQVARFFREKVALDHLHWTSVPQSTDAVRDISEEIFKGDLRINSRIEDATAFGDFLQEFSSIDVFQLDIFDAAWKNDGEQRQLELSVRLDFRAVLDGASPFTRLNDKATLRMVFAESETKESWSLILVESVESERLLSTRDPIFVNATNKWKLDALPVTDRKEAIRRGGYALAVVDLDGDSLKDMIVGHYGPVQILKNTGESFVDVTKEYGILEEGSVKSAAVDDLDNDGDKDIVFLRFVEQGQDMLGDFIAYENIGEKGEARFKQHRNLLPRERRYDRAMPLTLSDFNGDGHTDIYIGFPGLRDFTSGIYNRTRPDDLFSQGMWYNKGDWTFEELDTEFGLVNDNGVYAHASLASDLDGDGRPELIVVDDSGRINPIYQRGEDGRYTETSESMGLKMSGMSMGMTTGDFNNDGHIDIIASNVTLTAGERLFNMAQRMSFADDRYKKNFADLQESYSGLLLYQNQGDGTFEDVTEKSELAWSGEAASAGEWIDYNHDGLLDYYLPNGLWTNGDEQLDSVFFRAELAAHADPLHTNIIADAEFSSRQPAGLEDMQTLKLDFDNDVHGGSNFATVREEERANPILRLLRRHKNDADGYSFSLGGKQRNRLYRNNGDGTFTEVGYLEGADCVEDGYIVAPVDIDNNGTQDLVLRNTDPAIGYDYDPVILLENQSKRDSIEVLFDGTRSPLGARVVAEFSSPENGTHVVTREVRSVNGAVQSEPSAFFGVPDQATLVKIQVHWSDGTVQDLDTPVQGKLRVRADM